MEVDAPNALEQIYYLQQKASPVAVAMNELGFQYVDDIPTPEPSPVSLNNLYQQVENPVMEALSALGLQYGTEERASELLPVPPIPQEIQDLLGQSIQVSTIQLLNQGGETQFAFGVMPADQCAQLMITSSSDDEKERLDTINQVLFNAPVENGENPSPSMAYSGILLDYVFDEQGNVSLFIGLPDEYHNGDLLFPIDTIVGFTINKEDIPEAILYTGDPVPQQKFLFTQIIGIVSAQDQTTQFIIGSDESLEVQHTNRTR